VLPDLDLADWHGIDPIVGEPVRTDRELQPESDGGQPPHPDHATTATPVESEPYVPSEEDFAPSPPRPKSPLSQFPKADSLRPALVCFALFFVASLRTWTAPDADGLWVSGESIFVRHEYWRLLSALFAHSDIGHLLSNAPLFLIFGWFLRAFFGLRVFPAATLAIGALSNLATVYYYEPQVHLLGASGMLYGMVALWLVLYVRFETQHSVPMRIFRAMAVSLLMLFPTTFQPTTSYMAHAAGFAIGLVFGYAMAPFLSVRSPDGAPVAPAPADDDPLGPPNRPRMRLR
jgi:membrane associated rhomboid family serine protease